MIKSWLIDKEIVSRSSWHSLCTTLVDSFTFIVDKCRLSLIKLNINHYHEREINNEKNN